MSAGKVSVLSQKLWVFLARVCGVLLMVSEICMQNLYKKLAWFFLSRISINRTQRREAERLVLRLRYLTML